jgi:predicted DNA-binding ribbon-helix-helix protein
MLELNREYHMAHLRGQAVKKSLVLKRVIAGHKTSVSLEGKFWDSLKEIAVERGITIKELVAAIDADREHGNLSSAIRLFVLGVYRDQRAEAPVSQGEVPPLRPQAECAGACGYPENNPAQANENQRSEWRPLSDLMRRSGLHSDHRLTLFGRMPIAKA